MDRCGSGRAQQLLKHSSFSWAGFVITRAMMKRSLLPLSRSEFLRICQRSNEQALQVFGKKEEEQCRANIGKRITSPQKHIGTVVLSGACNWRTCPGTATKLLHQYFGLRLVTPMHVNNSLVCLSGCICLLSS